MHKPYRHPVRSFLRIYSPAIASWAMLSLAVIAAILDYSLNTDGFVRYFIAVTFNG